MHLQSLLSLATSSYFSHKLQCRLVTVIMARNVWTGWADAQAQFLPDNTTKMML